MTYLTDQEDARDNLAATLKILTGTLTADLASPKTSYNADGRTWNHSEWLKRLTGQISEINVEIKEITTRLIDEQFKPFMRVT